MVKPLVFQLPPATLDELVVDLSRVSSLPFQLHSESWIKRHHHDQDSLAFAFEKKTNCKKLDRKHWGNLNEYRPQGNFFSKACLVLHS